VLSNLSTDDREVFGAALIHADERTHHEVDGIRLRAAGMWTRGRPRSTRPCSALTRMRSAPAGEETTEE
jgi:hypothetical protein